MRHDDQSKTSAMSHTKSSSVHYFDIFIKLVVAALILVGLVHRATSGHW